MRLIQLVLVLACSLASLPARAADQSVTMSGTGIPFTYLGVFLSIAPGAPPLIGGDDVITFTGLPAGSYDFLLSVSAQNITELDATMNGAPADIYEAGLITFVGLDGTGTAPFSLVLTGIAGPLALYSGELTATLVPEAGTLALLLTGLAGIGVAGRRR